MPNPDPTLEWLLDPSQPAARFLALRDLSGLPANDPDLLAARAAIGERGWAADLLADQDPAGFWVARSDLYRPKYQATLWKTIVLVDLGLTRDDPRLAAAFDLIFAEWLITPEQIRRDSECCASGNLARILILAGYADDWRTGVLLDWIVASQKPDGGWNCFPDGAGTLDGWEPLSALAVLPREAWTPALRQAAERGAQFFLERELHREGDASYAPWFNFHFPAHYYYDLLVGLDILTALGHGADPRLATALAHLNSKQRPDGTWALDAHHPDMNDNAGYRVGPGVTPLVLEPVGEPSKLVTLAARRVLLRSRPTLARPETITINPGK